MDEGLSNLSRYGKSLYADAPAQRIGRRPPFEDSSSAAASGSASSSSHASILKSTGLGESEGAGGGGRLPSLSDDPFDTMYARHRAFVNPAPAGVTSSSSAAREFVL